MRVTHVQRMTEAAHKRRKLDVDGNPIIGRRYWRSFDLDDRSKPPISLAFVPPPRKIITAIDRHPG